MKSTDMNYLCLICGCQNTVSIRPYKYKNEIFAASYLVKCEKCGFVFSAPLPNENSLALYNTNYFSIAHGQKPKNGLEKAFFSGIAKLRKAYVDTYLNRNRISVSRLLEIGPGQGYFARNWISQNPNTQYSALETDVTCHGELAKYGVQLVQSIENQDVGSIYDLVVLSHVLEHVTDPRKFIQETTMGLRKGGVIFIEVPCRDWEHKSIDEPHLLFFDKYPMTKLLELVGFENIQLDYYGKSLDELKNNTVVKKIASRILTKLLTLLSYVKVEKIESGPNNKLSLLERVAVHPYKAHRPSAKPAWWLRVVAQKRGT